MQLFDRNTDRKILLLVEKERECCSESALSTGYVLLNERESLNVKEEDEVILLVMEEREFMLK